MMKCSYIVALDKNDTVVGALAFAKHDLLLMSEDELKNNLCTPFLFVESQEYALAAHVWQLQKEFVLNTDAPRKHQQHVMLNCQKFASPPAKIEVRSITIA